MAGSSVAVTDAGLADLVLEYAKQLGRARTTDIVRLPVVRDGRVEEASLLLGPASELALSRNDDAKLEAVEFPKVAAIAVDLLWRIDALTRRSEPCHGEDADPLTSDVVFVDFSAYDV